MSQDNDTRFSFVFVWHCFQFEVLVLIELPLTIVNMMQR